MISLHRNKGRINLLNHRLKGLNASNTASFIFSGVDLKRIPTSLSACFVLLSALPAYIFVADGNREDFFSVPASARAALYPDISQPLGEYDLSSHQTLSRVIILLKENTSANLDVNLCLSLTKNN